MSSDLAQRITRMYEVYAPEKVSRVPAFLEANAGREEEVLEKLIEKYGPEPDQQPTTAPTAVPTASSPVATVAVGSSSPPPKLASPASPVQSQMLGPTSAAQPIDIMHDLRMQVRQDCGFLTREHELMWEDAWMGKMPLGTLRKTWDLNRSVLLAGLGNKLSSHARPVRRWQQRFFVLAPPFLYYFNADHPTSICKGALYLDRATITEEAVNGFNAITILSRVTKKPLELDRRGDYSTFVIRFDTEKQQGTWLNMLRQVSLIGDVGSSAKAFGAYPLSGAGLLNVIAGGAPTSPLSTDNQALAAVAMLGSSTQPIQAPPGVTQAQFQQQQVQHLNSIGVTPQLLQAASASSMNANAPRSLLHPMFNNYSVDANEVKRRIARLARDRDPVRMSEVFLQFVQDHVENAQLLWRLMENLEEIEPFTGPTYTQAQHHLNNLSGYGYGYGGYAAGVPPQQALVSAHRQLFGPSAETEHSQLMIQDQGRHVQGIQGNTTSSFFVPPHLLGAELSSDSFNRQEMSSTLLRAATNQRMLETTRDTVQPESGYRMGLNSSHNADDTEFQRRLERIRDRKHLLAKLVKDMPQQ